MATVSVRYIVHDVDARRDSGGGFDVRPIGHVESTLTEVADAPNQGDQGAHGHQAGRLCSTGIDAYRLAL